MPAARGPAAASGMRPDRRLGAPGACGRTDAVVRPVHQEGLDPGGTAPVRAALVRVAHHLAQCGARRSPEWPARVLDSADLVHRAHRGPRSVGRSRPAPGNRDAEEAGGSRETEAGRRANRWVPGSRSGGPSSLALAPLGPAAAVRPGGRSGRSHATRPHRRAWCAAGRRGVPRAGDRSGGGPAERGARAAESLSATGPLTRAIAFTNLRKPVC